MTWGCEVWDPHVPLRLPSSTLSCPDIPLWGQGPLTAPGDVRGGRSGLALVPGCGMPQGGTGGGPVWPCQGLTLYNGMDTAVSGYAASVSATQGTSCVWSDTLEGVPSPPPAACPGGWGGPMKAKEPSHHTGQVREWWHKMAPLSLAQRQPR